MSLEEHLPNGDKTLLAIQLEATESYFLGIFCVESSLKASFLMGPSSVRHISNRIGSRYLLFYAILSFSLSLSQFLFSPYFILIFSPRCNRLSRKQSVVAQETQVYIYILLIKWIVSNGRYTVYVQVGLSNFHYILAI